MNHLMPSVSRVDTKWRVTPVAMNRARMTLYTTYQVLGPSSSSHSLRWNKSASSWTRENLPLLIFTIIVQ